MLKKKSQFQKLTTVKNIGTLETPCPGANTNLKNWTEKKKPSQYQQK